MTPAPPLKSVLNSFKTEIPINRDRESTNLMATLVAKCEKFEEDLNAPFKSLSALTGLEWNYDLYRLQSY